MYLTLRVDTCSEKHHQSYSPNHHLRNYGHHPRISVLEDSRSRGQTGRDVPRPSSSNVWRRGLHDPRVLSPSLFFHFHLLLRQGVVRVRELHRAISCVHLLILPDHVGNVDDDALCAAQLSCTHPHDLPLEPYHLQNKFIHNYVYHPFCWWHSWQYSCNGEYRRGFCQEFHFNVTHEEILSSIGYIHSDVLSGSCIFGGICHDGGVSCSMWRVSTFTPYVLLTGDRPAPTHIGCAPLTHPCRFVPYPYMEEWIVWLQW